MIRETLNLPIGDHLEELRSLALARWGSAKQALSCAAELNELAAKLIPIGQGRPVDSVFAVQEEICDVLITLDQMARVYFGSPEEFSETLRLKLQKLRNHLEPLPEWSK